MVAKDGSHLFYRKVKFNWLDGYYRRYTFGKGIPSNLHRAVWIDNFGPIPLKHHIHHKDRDPRNNHPENLQCVEGKLHSLRSAKQSSWVGSKGNLAVLAKARKKAKPWHRTKEGIEFHRMHAKNIGFGYKPVDFPRECAQCGKNYDAHQPNGKFCSRKCKSNFRYHSGVDNENRRCSICKKCFVVNCNLSSKTCSTTCRGKAHSKSNSIKRKRMQAPLQKIGIILREARLSKNMSQAELAKRSGIGRDSISLFENGKRAIKENAAKQLAKPLRIDHVLLLVKS